MPLNIKNYIEHTLLKADATQAEIEEHCRQGLAHRFFAVCIPPSYVRLAKDLLKGTPVNVCTVAGFPLGYSSSLSKISEVYAAMEEDADEVDFVANIGYIKNGQWTSYERELSQITGIAQKKKIKIILETGLLSSTEIQQASQRGEDAGADFIKTCTGFGPRGVTLEDIRTIAAVLKGRARIKASGGIKDRAFGLDLIRAGASRLGTSHSLSLIENKE